MSDAMNLTGVSIYPAWGEHPCIVCEGYPEQDMNVIQKHGTVWLCGPHLQAFKDHPLVVAHDELEPA